MGHRGQRDGIGTNEHLAFAVADGQRRAFAGRNDQIILAFKEEG